MEKEMVTAMSVLDLISSKTKLLPPELQQEVLDFVEFLGTKKSVNSTYSEEQFPQLPNTFGAGRGLVTYMADDFDAPLDDLKEYMF
ncbi:MAG: DUF2281 domain-containing protein [Spirosomataceae bacterium]